MSFTSDIKAETARHMPEKASARKALLAALSAFCCHIAQSAQGLGLVWETRSPPVARLLFRLIKAEADCIPDIQTSFPETIHQGRLYRLSLNAENSLRLANGDLFSITKATLRGSEEKQAYLRGAFLGGATILDPRKRYRLEFYCPREEHAKRLEKLLLSYETPGKRIEKGEYHVLYLKNSEHISQILLLIGAHQAYFRWENARMNRKTRADATRAVNCDTANMNKIGNAGENYASMINYIEAEGFLTKLPPAVQELALLRRENPYISLEDLGEMLSPPASKSAVNHRLRKLKALYNTLTKGE